MQIQFDFRPAGAGLRSRIGVLPLALVLAASALAGQTRYWGQSEFEEFDKGSVHGLSIRSDGRLTLAPRFEERLDSSSAYLWALAADSKGNLYAGGGPGAKLFRVAPNGDKKTVAELDALEIHAIAVDAKDNVYAATSPDGRVYRLSGGGKPEVFYTPKSKYIWALAFDSRGNLLVATGGPGGVDRVSPSGKSEVLYASADAHVRSMAVDAKDNAVLGTEPDGLVVRVSPKGEGFVLYEMGKKEITAVAVARDGCIYAAGTGNKQAGVALPAPALAVAPMPAQAAGGVQVTMRPTAPAAPPSSMGGAVAAIAGGSEVYRIDADGYPSKFWSHPQEIVYAIGFDAEDRVVIGTGNKGSIYRVESERLYTALLNAPPTQVTAFAAGPAKKLYAATGNVGKVYQIGPELEKEGTFESDVFDAGMFSRWGRIKFLAEGGRVSVATRSGNLDRPHSNWSPWSAPIAAVDGGRIESPPARFLQYKATLGREDGKPAPELVSVDAAYLPRNVAPKVTEIEITPSNYRFPVSTLTLTPSRTLALQPLGRRTPAASGIKLTLETPTPALEYAKGHLGARWLAADDNGDTMIYTVWIRGENENEWKLLREKVREKYLSWDSTAFPDGDYRLRVSASDLPSNPKEQALGGWLDGYAFTIDNTPPRIEGLAASFAGGKLEVRWKAADALSTIDKAEYSLDGGEWTLVMPTSGLSDSRELEYVLALAGVAPGEHTVAVRVSDEQDNQAAAKAVVR